VRQCPTRAKSSSQIKTFTGRHQEMRKDLERNQTEETIKKKREETGDFPSIFTHKMEMLLEEENLLNSYENM
jgi:hypothetical protein